MYLGVKNVSGVPSVVYLVISGIVALGVRSVFAHGVTGKVALWVPGDVAIGIHVFFLLCYLNFSQWVFHLCWR